MDDRARSCRGASHTRRVSLSHSGPRIHVAQMSSRAGRRAGGGSHRRNLPPGLQSGTGDPWASSPATRWPGLDPAPQEAEGQIAPRFSSSLHPRPQAPAPSAVPARRVQQLRLLLSRWCLGFNFCVALRKLPIITAAERNRSPRTAALQLCRLLRTAGRG